MTGSEEEEFTAELAEGPQRARRRVGKNSIADWLSVWCCGRFFEY